MIDELLLPRHGNTGRPPANKRKRYGRLKLRYAQAPWNKPGDEQVFLCESVRRWLKSQGVKNRHTRNISLDYGRKIVQDSSAAPGLQNASPKLAGGMAAETRDG